MADIAKAVLAGKKKGVGVLTGFATPASLIDSGDCDYICAVYDSGSDKIIITYKNNIDSKGYAVVGTLTGSTLSLGTPVSYSTSSPVFPRVCYDSANNKIVIAFTAYTSANSQAIVGTVSGTSISFGTPVVFVSDGNMSACDIAFDETNSKVVIAHKGTNKSAYVGTVSGTSISFGTPTNFTTNNAYFTSIVYDPISTKMILCYSDQSNSGKLTSVVGTVSGTSISFGTPVALATGSTTTEKHEMVAVDGDIAVVYSDISAVTANIVIITISGTTPSFGTPVVFQNMTGAYDGRKDVFVDNNLLYVVYKGLAATPRPTLVNVEKSGTSLTLGTPVDIDTKTLDRRPAAVFNTTSKKSLLFLTDSSSTEDLYGYVGSY